MQSRTNEPSGSAKLVEKHKEKQHCKGSGLYLPEDSPRESPRIVYAKSSSPPLDKEKINSNQSKPRDSSPNGINDKQDNYKRNGFNKNNTNNYPISNDGSSRQENCEKLRPTITSGSSALITEEIPLKRPATLNLNDRNENNKIMSKFASEQITKIGQSSSTMLPLYEKPSIQKLKKQVMMSLNRKVANSFSNNTDSYCSKIIETIMNGANTHLVCVFKEHLINDDTDEFLRRYYTKPEIPPRLRAFCELYAKIAVIRPNYVILVERQVLQENAICKKRLIRNKIKPAAQEAQKAASPPIPANLHNLFTSEFFEELDKDDQEISARKPSTSQDQTKMQTYLKAKKSSRTNLQSSRESSANPPNSGRKSKEFPQTPKENEQSAKEILQTPKQILNQTPKESSKDIIAKETPKESFKEIVKQIQKESPKEIKKGFPTEIIKESPQKILKESPVEIPKNSPMEILKGSPKENIISQKEYTEKPQAPPEESDKQNKNNKTPIEGIVPIEEKVNIREVPQPKATQSCLTLTEPTTSSEQIQKPISINSSPIPILKTESTPTLVSSQTPPPPEKPKTPPSPISISQNLTHDERESPKNAIIKQKPHVPRIPLSKCRIVAANSPRRVINLNLKISTNNSKSANTSPSYVPTKFCEKEEKKETCNSMPSSKVDPMSKSNCSHEEKKEEKVNKKSNRVDLPRNDSERLLPLSIKLEPEPQPVIELPKAKSRTNTTFSRRKSCEEVNEHDNNKLEIEMLSPKYGRISENISIFKPHRSSQPKVQITPMQILPQIIVANFPTCDSLPRKIRIDPQKRSRDKKNMLRCQTKDMPISNKLKFVGTTPTTPEASFLTRTHKVSDLEHKFNQINDVSVSRLSMHRNSSEQTKTFHEREPNNRYSGMMISLGDKYKNRGHSIIKKKS